MRAKGALTLIAAAAIAAATCSAGAYARDWRYRGGGWGYHAPVYNYHRSGIGPGGAAALGFLGGAILGGALASRPSTCYGFVGYDLYSNPIYGYYNC